MVLWDFYLECSLGPTTSQTTFRVHFAGIRPLLVTLSLVCVQHFWLLPVKLWFQLTFCALKKSFVISRLEPYHFYLCWRFCLLAYEHFRTQKKLLFLSNTYKLTFFCNMITMSVFKRSFSLKCAVGSACKSCVSCNVMSALVYFIFYDSYFI